MGGWAEEGRGRGHGRGRAMKGAGRGRWSEAAPPGVEGGRA